MYYLVVYVIGVLVTGFFVGYTKTGWDGVDVAGTTLFWPLTLPALIGNRLKRNLNDRALKKTAIEIEKQKWLKAPIP